MKGGGVAEGGRSRPGGVSCGPKVAKTLSKKQKRRMQRSERRGTRSDSDESSIPPMPETAGSADPWDFRQSVGVVAADRPSPPKKKKKKKGEGGDGLGVKACPEGHELRMFFTPHDEFFCELCGEQQYLPAGAMLFGCRACDWDACEAHTHSDVKTKELLRHKQMSDKNKAKAVVPKEGVWKLLRGADKYKNEFMCLRHTGSKVVLELAGHSGIITVRAGAGEPPHFCTEKGDTAPFELAMPGLAQRLDSGEGKALVKNKEAQLGNWSLLTLDDGSAVATHQDKFIKTSKHKQSDSVPDGAPSQGLEVHMTPMGEIVWISPHCLGEVALIIVAHQPPKKTSASEAVKWLGVDDELSDDDQQQGDGTEAEVVARAGVDPDDNE